MDPSPIPERQMGWGPYLLFGLPLLIGAAVALVFVVMLFWPAAGVRFTVVNQGPQPLRTVTLILPDSVHVLGDMEPGQSAWRKTRVGEGGVAIEYSEKDGKRTQLPVQGYLSNSDGEFIIELRDGKVTTVQDHTRINPF
jgi:hypothetical protein